MSDWSGRVAEAFNLDRPLPVGERGHNSTGWLGVLCLIATEGSLFAYLLFSYAYAVAQHGPEWLPSLRPSLAYALPGTIILLASSFIVWWGERGVRQGKRVQQLVGIGGAALMGIVFLIIQYFEWTAKPFSLSSSGYGSFFFTITGFHMAHVVVGVVSLSVVFLWSLAGNFGPRRHAHVAIVSIYWHFVDIVWLAVFSAFYLAPYLTAAR